MEVNINGEPASLAKNISIHQLLAEQGLLEKRLAIEVNMEIIPRSTFTTHHLCDGDQIEIVHAIGGG